jgi:hypothetical protein
MADERRLKDSCRCCQLLVMCSERLGLGMAWPSATQCECWKNSDSDTPGILGSVAYWLQASGPWETSGWKRQSMYQYLYYQIFCMDLY